MGYLGCDEFAMLKPITQWIKASERPFFLTVMCSVTHDPYVVPEWFGEPAEKPLQRYQQAIAYTDEFIAALDAKLSKLGLTDKTVFCVVGDHGEAFGEHGLFGHERIAFDEVLRVPLVVRAPGLIEAGTTVSEAVSSIDLTPTLLAFLGFEAEVVDFDGVNLPTGVSDEDILTSLSETREVFFSGWLSQSPSGFIKDGRKFIYNPTNGMLYAYNLKTDPFEKTRVQVAEEQAENIVEKIINWRKESIFRIEQTRAGENILFNCWLCEWTGRVAKAKLQTGQNH